MYSQTLYTRKIHGYVIYLVSYRNYWWVYASYKKVYNSTYVTRDLLTKMYINFFNVRYRIYNLIFAA